MEVNGSDGADRVAPLEESTDRQRSDVLRRQLSTLELIRSTGVDVHIVSKDWNELGVSDASIAAGE
jgi:hypothetical protein